MPKKYSNEEFIEKAKNIHGNEYEYSKINYINSSTKIKIICRKHGIFEQIPSSHLTGKGCPYCYGSFKKSMDFILENFKIIHGDKYDYSLMKYVNLHSKIKIICPEHGIFEQVCRSHMRGNGCPKCAKVAKYDFKELVNIFNEKHSYKYDYSTSIFKNINTKIEIFCHEHGKFDQTPYEHMKGGGCPICSKKKQYTIETFTEKSKQIHGEKYDYSLVEYINNKTHVNLICPKHGIFSVRPDNHINSKNGCPSCSESLGEREISILLKNQNIKFERQKKFEKCINIKSLYFDFYLPDYNCCIEYDGKQHDEPISYFGGAEAFEKQLISDQIKTQYCLDNNIQLIRIKYDENIEEKLSLIKKPSE